MEKVEYKIMVVEDDPVIAGAVARQLTAWGCQTHCCVDFGNVLADFLAYRPHLLILDIGLPLFNGYHWCAEIRQVSQVPILFLSSAAENMNIVMAVNMGGDDFVSKPFALDVLTAKVQALLRRAYAFHLNEELLESRGAALNIADASLTYQGERLELTKNEYRILHTLMKNKGRIVSRDALMQILWENDEYVDENTLTVNVTRLRRRLEALGLKDFIHTKKGSGYLVE